MDVGAISSLAEGLTLPLAIQGAFKPPSAISRTRYAEAAQRALRADAAQPRASVEQATRREAAAAPLGRAQGSATGGSCQCNTDGDSLTLSSGTATEALPTAVADQLLTRTAFAGGLDVLA